MGGYVLKVKNDLIEAGIRAEVNASSESLGKRIRAADKQKIPYILIVGQKEMNDQGVAVRSRNQGDEGMMGIVDFTERIKKEIENKIR